MSQNYVNFLFEATVQSFEFFIPSPRVTFYSLRFIFSHKLLFYSSRPFIVWDTIIWGLGITLLILDIELGVLSL